MSAKKMVSKRYRVTITTDSKPFTQTVESENTEGALRKVLPEFFRGQDYTILQATVEVVQLSE